MNALNQELVSCVAADTVREVAVLMKKKNVEAVPVTKNGVLQGLITERDLVLRCLAETASGGPLTAGDVMTRVVETVRFDESVYSVAEKMKKANARRNPVVDHSGKALGVLSFDDLIQSIGMEIQDLVDATQPLMPALRRQVA